MEKVQTYFSDVSSAPLPRNFMLHLIWTVEIWLRFYPTTFSDTVLTRTEDLSHRGTNFSMPSPYWQVRLLYHPPSCHKRSNLANIIEVVAVGFYISARNTWQSLSDEFPLYNTISVASLVTKISRHVNSFSDRPSNNIIEIGRRSVDGEVYTVVWTQTVPLAPSVLSIH